MNHLACMKGGLAVSQTLAYTGLFLPAWGPPAQLGSIDSSELTALCVGQAPRKADSDLLWPWLCSSGPLIFSQQKDLLCPVLTPIVSFSCQHPQEPCLYTSCRQTSFPKWSSQWGHSQLTADPRLGAAALVF